MSDAKSCAEAKKAAKRAKKAAKRAKKPPLYLVAKTFLMISIVMGLALSIFFLLLFTPVASSLPLLLISIPAFLILGYEMQYAITSAVFTILLIILSVLLLLLSAIAAFSSIWSITALSVTRSAVERRKYNTFGILSLVFNIFPVISPIGILGSVLLLCSGRKTIASNRGELTVHHAPQTQGSAEVCSIPPRRVNRFCTVTSKVIFIIISSFSGAKLIFDWLMSMISDAIVSAFDNIREELFAILLGDSYAEMMTTVTEVYSYLAAPLKIFGVVEGVLSVLELVISIAVVVFGFVLVWRINVSAEKRQIIGWAIAAICIYTIIGQNVLGVLAAVLLLFSGKHEYGRRSSDIHINAKSNNSTQESEVITNEKM